ncbi:MAG: [Fe-Fe] hydrogenase large subunit C-terminal domain-containing protein [Bacteroidales bacterium]|nr:[Fe-Fe] hydrogenase large subunit C-terminal domain-containing protein [Bacteroidales bacterium]
MEQKLHKRGLVYTVKDLCRVCYTCVRECPVKAIRIVDGQAEVVAERCIACGNCTIVCSQGAKVYERSIDRVEALLQGDSEVVALVAPSYVAEFEEIPDLALFAGMIKKLGFTQLFEVGMGADLVAEAYEKLINENPGKGYINSDCPAIVSFIEKYHPDLTGSLIPVVSPMVATVRYIRQVLHSQAKMVFIGPCVAKKGESDEVDEVLTFAELRSMFTSMRVRASNVEPASFTPPLAMKGAGFPVSRGLLQAMNLEGNHVDQRVIVAEGRVHFQEAIREYASGKLDSMQLELLCCEGCIMGPGTSPRGKKFVRRSLVLNHLFGRLDQAQTESEGVRAEGCRPDLSRSFKTDDQRIKAGPEDEIDKVLLQMGKFSQQDHLDCGACGYDTCLSHARAITQGLAEVEMCLPYSIDTLHQTIHKLADSKHKLLSVEQALRQSEKLAHMGQLSAGIAHELNNPLGVVIMYSNLLLEECARDQQLKEDLELIVEQAGRCKDIVGGLLNFARKNQVLYSTTDLLELIRMSTDSLIFPENISYCLNNHLSNPYADLDREQMVQVISNLLKNGIEAMPNGGALAVSLSDSHDWVIISIRDEGAGISPGDMEKVFEPFYTTKGIGKGTGLGLATTYGIVKMHRGQIDVKSNVNPEKGATGTEFTVKIPRKLLS